MALSDKAKAWGNTPAFPSEVDRYEPGPGMSLREYYIGQAMTRVQWRTEFGELDTHSGAREAIAMAEAVLEALAAEKP